MTLLASFDCVRFMPNQCRFDTCDFVFAMTVVAFHAYFWIYTCPGAIEMSNRAQMAAMMIAPSALAMFCVRESHDMQG